VTQAKLLTQRAICDVADEAIQIHGATATCASTASSAPTATPVSPIGGCTDEVMKEILGKQLGL